MSRLAKVETQTPQGAKVILLGCSHLSEAECGLVSGEIRHLKPGSVGLGIDRRETRARFPGTWMQMQPPAFAQSLTVAWPGLTTFVGSMFNSMASRQIAHLRPNWANAYAAAETAATAAGARLCTVGQQSSVRGAQSIHTIPLWIRLMAAESSALSLFWAAATHDRAGIASIASSAVHTVAEFWRPIMPDQELLNLQATATNFIKLYRDGMSSVDPFALVELYRQAGRTFLTARDAAGKAPPAAILVQQDLNQEAAAIAFNIQEMYGKTRVVVLQHHLLIPVALELKRGVSMERAVEANQLPEHFHFKQTILPTSIGAFFIGACGAAIAGRKHSARARLFLKASGLSVFAGSVAIAAPVTGIMALPAAVGQALELGSALQQHPEVLSAAKLAHNRGDTEGLARLYAATPQLARSLQGRGSAADDRVLAQLRIAREQAYSQERR